MKDKLLTTREVSHLLGVNEKEVIDLAKANIIPHFKVGGEFLRFKKEDILKIKRQIKERDDLAEPENKNLAKLKEFFYFHDFYIIGGIIIFILLWIILKDFSF